MLAWLKSGRTFDQWITFRCSFEVVDLVVVKVVTECRDVKGRRRWRRCGCGCSCRLLRRLVAFSYVLLKLMDDLGRVHKGVSNGLRMDFAKKY